jgi:hypothetical protein
LISPDSTPAEPSSPRPRILSDLIVIMAEHNLAIGNLRLDDAELPALNVNETDGAAQQSAATTGLLDLPTEVIEKIPLTSCDIFSMTKVCRRLNAIFNPLLYNSITFIGPEQVPWEQPRAITSEHVTQRIPTILTSLQALRERADPVRVRRLQFAMDGCHNYEFLHSQSSRQMRQLLSAVAPGLNMLQLRYCYDLCWDPMEVGPLPSLRTFSTNLPLGGPEDQRFLLHVLSQPNLRNIVLHYYNPMRTDSRLPNPLRDPAFRACHGKEVILRGCDLEPSVLRSVLQATGDLEALVFIRYTGYCAWSDADMMRQRYTPEPCSALKIKDLDGALALARRTLQKLVFIRSHLDQCLLDQTAIGSLKRFKSLRNLYIDDRYLLECVQMEDETVDSGPDADIGPDDHSDTESEHREADLVRRAPSMIADLLPKSIERLDLRIDQEKLQHRPTYPSEILEGLLTAKARLPKLVAVSILETSRDSPDSSWEGDEMGQSPIDASMIREMQERCARHGIRLRYLKQGWACFRPRPSPEYTGKLPAMEAPFHNLLYEPGTDPVELNIRNASFEDGFDIDPRKWPFYDVPNSDYWP